MKKKAAFYTLGCKVNFCETESMQVLFERAGYRIIDFEDYADVYIINTCTVTGSSDHKSRKAIRRARRNNPDAIVVATGCYAQGNPEELKKLDRVDLIIGNNNRENLPQIIESALPGSQLELVRAHRSENKFEILPPSKRRGRTRGFLKIQEGCNQFCSYCIIPSVRGPLRSLPPADALERAKTLIDSGCKEIVLTGIHLGLYGVDLFDTTLTELIGEMESLTGLLRLRLSSLEPSDVTAELVERIAGSKIVCPHLHIPLQSGDGEILRLMNRPYEPVEYLYLAQWLKQEIPGLSLSSDVIVGFPGESEQHHRRSMALIKAIGFSRLHVFKFSSRPGTRAAELPSPLPNEIKERRSREMIELGEKMASEYRRQFIGQRVPVLVEKVEPYSYGEGFTPHYLRVKVNTDLKAVHWRGKIVNALLEKEDGPYIKAVRVR
ncbi:MAG: tRNA (N(6)-L-threonylcarbamoyladenosine(37)-C(2))-methylthiotransferase MtaB [Bacillota bacterium]|nr:tRNA (N(6)-L-threonylcarbamoyladenosine(37)-C(2))-methylthiotransferase MtaB [Bacillota bacterium]